MVAPDFTAAGVLPPGAHALDEADLRAQFVVAFPASATRAAIFDFWQRHRMALDELVPVHEQWLDGSFATDKLDPADADVISFVDGPAFDALPRHRQLLVRQLLLGTRTEALWRCDSHPVVVYPEDHPGHRHTCLARGWWRSYFGRGRDGGAKGWLELGYRDDPPADDAGEPAGGAAASGRDSLVEHLDELDRVLAAFSAPIVDEHAGLRMVAAHLRARRVDVLQKLGTAEAGELEITVEGALVVEGSLPAGAVARLLAAVEAALAAVLSDRPPVGAPALRLVAVDGPTLHLRGPASIDARTAPRGRADVVDVAMRHLVEALQEGPPPDDLLALAAEHAATVRLRWQPVDADALEVTIRPACPSGG